MSAPAICMDDLIGFISKQLDPENLSSIINESILKSLNHYVDQYIKREIESLIYTTVQKEIESIKSQINGAIIDLYQHLQKNLDMLKSLQIFLANKTLSKAVDPISEAFDSFKFSEGFQMLLNLDDEAAKDEYLKIINFSQVNDENIDQRVAIDLATWAISRSNKDLLEKMILLIKKGEGLTFLLRKIVSKQDPVLSSAKAMIIKKSL